MMADIEQKRTVGTTVTKDLELGVNTKKAAAPTPQLGKLKISKPTDGVLDKALGFGRGNTIIDKIINKLASFIKSLENWILGRANTVEPVIKLKKKKLGTNEDIR